jgi:5-methylcytosine-specific restriction protein A
MSRATAEWMAKTDDAKIPPRVRMRVFDRAKGVCHWCKIVIKAPPETWQADHVKALINGGEHRETNLAPIHDHCHIEKTGADVAVKKKVAAVRKKHLGIVTPAQPIRSAPFAISPKTAKRQANAAAKLDFTTRRQLFAKESTP